MVDDTPLPASYAYKEGCGVYPSCDNIYHSHPVFPSSCVFVRVRRGEPENEAAVSVCVCHHVHLRGMFTSTPPPSAVHSEANTRRIHIVEQCFGGSGQVMSNMED